MSRSPLLWLAAVLLLAASLGANHGTRGPSILAAALLACLAGAAILLAGWWPRSAVALAGLATGGYFAAGLHNGPLFFALPLTFLGAAQRRRPEGLASLGVAALGLGVAGLVLRAGVHGVGWSETFWESAGVVALCVGASFAGWSMADRRDAREAQARRAASEERLLMARDLHDGVGHGLAVIAMQAGVALHVLDHDPVAVRRSLEAIRATSHESLEALRTELARLSGAGDGDAARRPAAGLEDLDDLLARVRAGGLTVVREGDVPAVPDAVGQAVYAVVQESLTNVLRHARASRVTVRLAVSEPELSVTVTDDGSGAAARQDGGMGIDGMRSRVQALGGTLEAGPVDGGFRVVARIPR